mgnify:CR=1 FL=1|jgi:hypothetical protein
MYIRSNTPKSTPTPTQPPKETLWITVDPDQPNGDCEPPPPPAQLKNKISILDPLPAVVINEKTLIFRMDSRTLWTKYALGLVNYAVSSVAELSTTPSVEERLTKSATLIGDYFVPYYGIRAGSEIGKLLADIFETGVEVVEVSKSKGDIVPLQIKWAEQTKLLAELFNKLNPGQYPTSLLEEMLHALTKLWTDNINARITKNIIMNAESIDGINKLVITGIANHVNKGYQSLADVLSRGVIAQYPLSFVD